MRYGVNGPVYSLLHVDDVLIISKNLNSVEMVKKKIFEDNQSAIAIAESDGHSKKVKHSEVKQSIVT